MSTMLFADEVNDPSRIEELPDPDDVKTTDKELSIAKQLVDSLAGPFEPDKYHDEYREQILALIERKAAGEEVIVAQEPEAEPAEVPDLMAALQASLDAVRGAGSSAPAKGKKAPAESKTRQKSAAKG
jgi:DNA end-binding protein Ku